MQGPEFVSLDDVAMDDIVALMRGVLGPGPTRTREFFEWKHRHNPFGPSAAIVAVADGRPVGLRIFLRWRWHVGHRYVEAVRAVDTVTDAAWRRQGLFRALTTELVEQVRSEGAALIFNTPNPRSGAGYLTMGWERVGRLALCVSLRRPVRAARRYLRSAATEANNEVPLPQKSNVLATLDSEDCLRLLAMDVPAIDGFHVKPTSRYLRWRYGTVPGVDYQARLVVDGDAATLLIGRVRVRRGVRELALAEVIVRGAPRAAVLAGDAIRRLAAEEDADYVVALSSRDQLVHAAQRRAGLVPIGRRGPTVFANVLVESLRPDPRRWAAWSPTIGALELF